MDQRIRLLRVLPTLDFGGVESRAVIQAQHHDRERFDLRVCAFWDDGDAAARIREAGVPVDILGVDPSPRNLAATATFIDYLEEKRPDVLHTSIAEANFHGALAGALTDVPVRIAEAVGVPGRSPLGHVIYGQLWRLVDRVVGVSKVSCEYLRHRDNAPKGSVELVYNCANPSFFDAEPRLSRPVEDRFEILAVGRLVPVKNHAMLIRAVGRAVEHDPRIRLRIVGDGPLKGELQELVDELDLHDHVELPGFQTDIAEKLAAAHLFVLPSHSEGCSISLVEAMSTATPALGSDAAGIIELLGELGSDWHLPDDDEEAWARRMVEIAAMDTPERAAVGQRLRQIACERFAPQVYLNNLQSLYIELVEQKLHDAPRRKVA